MEYCRQGSYNHRDGNTNVFLNFLAAEYDRGLKYRTLKGYKAALIEFLPRVDNNQVKKFFKGVFNNRPPMAN